MNVPKRRVRIFVPIVAASAVVAFGALTAAVHQEQAPSGPGIGYVSKSGPSMTLGDTETTTAEPSVLATEKAEPPVKAVPYGGAGAS